MHILWFCGKFCHAHILKTELAFHQQYQCYYREATCETCHQKYRPAQGDCSCKDNIYNNNNGNDYTICYRCGRYKNQCTCNSNNPYDINNPPGGGGGEGGTHSGGSGSSSNNNTQEDDTEERSNSKRIYSIEQEIGFAKKFSKRVEAIIEQLQSNKKIEIMDIENPKYDPEKNVYFFPKM